MAQPPSQQPTASGGSGLDTKMASTLCYALWWITGIIFLVLDGKRDPEIRFHAWQSIAFFGGISVLNFGFSIIGGIIGGGVGALFAILSTLLGLGGFIVWIVILIQTYQGKRLVLPIAGAFAEQQAAKG
jgi:uncharacterized membrane protein